jgi:hypothetical protein
VGIKGHPPSPDEQQYRAGKEPGVNLREKMTAKAAEKPKNEDDGKYALKGIRSPDRGRAVNPRRKDQCTEKKKAGGLNAEANEKRVPVRLWFLHPGGYKARG